MTTNRSGAAPQLKPLVKAVRRVNLDWSTRATFEKNLQLAAQLPVPNKTMVVDPAYVAEHIKKV
jgi:hypothetical protein